MTNETVLVTGSDGFIGSAICDELLQSGYNVFGIDIHCKYGPVRRKHHSHPNFKLFKIDLEFPNYGLEFPQNNIDGLERKLEHIDFQYLIAGAALIGGISMFHKYAGDIMTKNERIMANTIEFAKNRFVNSAYNFKRFVAISSSMVFERTDKYPTPETEIEQCNPPISTYGFQKLSCEYFCKGFWEQYRLPYSIVRPFNAIGQNEDEAIGETEESIGNVKMMMSHVVPDIINRAIILGPDKPLPILGLGNQKRSYTNVRDIARGIRLVMESPKAINQDFNIACKENYTVKEVCEIIYNKLYGHPPVGYVNEKPYQYDVQCRIPDVSKAEKILGFRADIPLEKSIDEVIEYIKDNKAHDTDKITD